MADITMCTGKDCQSAETCYRFKARPSPQRQAYFLTPPVKSDGTCGYYWADNHKEGVR